MVTRDRGQFYAVIAITDFSCTHRNGTRDTNLTPGRFTHNNSNQVPTKYEVKSASQFTAKSLVTKFHPAARKSGYGFILPN